MLASQESVGVRGAPWVIADKDDPEVFYLITFATVTEAVYKAWELQPENPQARSTLAKWPGWQLS